LKSRHIVKRYGDFEAVKDVSFSVAEGEIFGLLGPNGAGKSTLIRMMTTLIPLTSGKALVAGHDVAKEPDAVRRMIGVIPQALTSDPDLTVEENLSIYAKLYSRSPRPQRIQEHPGCPRGRRSCQMARRAGQDPLRRNEAPGRDRPRPGPQSAASSFSTSQPPASIRSRASPSGRC
jgi:ABC-type sugar transport system ATPase subunit